MTMQFNKARGTLVRPEWPENPSKAPTLFSNRQPLRKLRALVDAEMLNTSAAEEELDKSSLLMALLESDMIEWYRYANEQPPPDIAPVDLSFPTPYPAYSGWVVSYPFEQDKDHFPVAYSAKSESYTLGGVGGRMVELARTEESQRISTEPDPEQRATMRATDMLALQVADRVLQADVFITHRPYLHSDSPLVSRSGTTVCTRDEAIPLIALYLRAQSEFVLPAGAPGIKYRFQRGLYYWVGARELLPEAWRWFSACVQHSSATNNDKLELLGGSLLSRMTKALRERDDVYIALNQPTSSDTADEALSSLDNVLVSLMGAVDVAARVAHYVLTLSGDEREAGWQKDKWRKQVSIKEPMLAATVLPGTPGENTLTILRKLRNSVHGAALQGVTYFREGKAETRIGLPADDEAAILAAMDAMGGRGSWGVRSLGGGLNLIQPTELVDRLIEAAVQLLNELMNKTPVELLPHVKITTDSSKPPVDPPPRGRFDTFSEWNRLAIRWQLGF